MPSALYSVLFHFQVLMSQHNLPWWDPQTSFPHRMKGWGRNQAAMKLLQWEHFSVVMEEQEIRPLPQVSLTGFSWGVIVVQSEYPFSLALTFVSLYQFLFLFQMTHGRIYLERRGSGGKEKILQKSLSQLLAPILAFQQIFLSSAQWSSRRQGSIFILTFIMCLTTASIHESIPGPIPWLLQLHLTIILHLSSRCIPVTNVFSKMLHTG